MTETARDIFVHVLSMKAAGKPPNEISDFIHERARVGGHATVYQTTGAGVRSYSAMENVSGLMGGSGITRDGR